MKTELRIFLGSLTTAMLIAGANLAKGPLWGGAEDAVLFTLAGSILLTSLLVGVLRANSAVQKNVRTVEEEEEIARISLGSPLHEVRGPGLARLILALPNRITVLLDTLRNYGTPLLLIAVGLLLASLATLAATLNQHGVLQ